MGRYSEITEPIGLVQCALFTNRSHAEPLPRMGGTAGSLPGIPHAPKLTMI